MSTQAPRLDSELDSFREQWLSDLRTRRHSSSSHQARPAYAAAASSPAPPLAPRNQQPAPPLSPSSGSRRLAPDPDVEDDYLRARAFDEPPAPAEYTLDGSLRPRPGRTLVSALDHYEEAMEKEAQGNMGESLKLYRQAYRLDHRVDRRYREKHFPPSSGAPSSAALLKLPSSTNPSPPSQENTTTTKGAAATTDDPTPQFQSTADLIDSFSHLAIVPPPPDVENTPSPPCPIASLPSELLAHILSDLAAADPGAFAAAALVCKRLAYLVATEQRIWRRVALSPDHGFPAMHYRFNRTVEWAELVDDAGFVDSSESRRAAESARAAATALVPGVWPSWRDMFRSRPRIRFNGCYISTVNYVRSGQMSTNQATWGGSPVHIVTYYRYLRFFRDGTAISLLTTSEPADVVHHLTRDLLRLHRDRPHHHNNHSHQHQHQHLPSAPMRLAHRGRWRLGSPPDDINSSNDGGKNDGEAALCIETEGVGPQYMYRMDMALRSAGRAARNNKLVWRAFHSYNKLTDDWAEFGPKNEKPFFFSRVRSYGMGE
ncbi:F-box-like domain-containing protein [Hirsutella rhossiliensis]|uniref:F-box-like domain-containing protein n=1 Tax=Hirsutella rhossiliensis TaxID=111463 RepID=A0A9P8SMH2_9HYPO|nr:f-box-like domain-containing protein [Hirsutella rhossiliensis]KAH0968583.1 f-box-like domain-containing protein [Hirsutella rhossiliensis]